LFEDNFEMSNPVLHYDFTMNLQDADINWCAVADYLKQICRQWCFQKEIGELRRTPHYQGRICLKEKMRLTTLRNKMKDSVLKGCHLSPTSTANKGNTFYVQKEEGRVDGPWSDKMNSSYIPMRVRNFVPYPWQQSMITTAALDDDRHINVIYDPVGGTGKSTFVTYMATHGKACSIPPMKDHKDIMRMVMNKPKSRCYMIDLPRASDKKHMTNMWAALETVKSGMAYDDRYEFKREFFEPPNIIVFTNVIPDRNLLSEDRWVVWTITGGNLVPYNE